MDKTQSLILLINTLSKSEKKAVRLQSELLAGDKKYMQIFNLIVDKSIEDSNLLQVEYFKDNPRSSFYVEVQYLYDHILEVLLRLKNNKDAGFALHQKLLNARILKDRNLDSDYYSALQDLKKRAKAINDHHILLQAYRLELDFIRENNFAETTEKELFHKQHKITNTLKTLRQINEQSTLYELLLYRSEKASDSKKEANRNIYKDLVLSELSLVNNLNSEVFEIQKLHQLFQARYFNAVGDHKSALNSFIELDNLFDRNKDQWHNPPIYYMSVLEGILYSLSQNKMYDQMSYFFDKLRGLNHPSSHFQTEIACILFIYTSLIYRNSGKVKACLDLIDDYNECLTKKVDLLTPYRFVELSVVIAVIYLENEDFTLARRSLHRIVNNNSYMSFNTYRVARLIYIITCYEMGDMDFVQSQIRSVKRYNKINKRSYEVESLLFKFMNTDLFSLSDAKKEQLRYRITSDFVELRKQKKDEIVINTFDFEGWMLSHI